MLARRFRRFVSGLRRAARREDNTIVVGGHAARVARAGSDAATAEDPLRPDAMDVLTIAPHSGDAARRLRREQSVRRDAGADASWLTAAAAARERRSRSRRRHSDPWRPHRSLSSLRRHCGGRRLARCGTARRIRGEAGSNRPHGMSRSPRLVAPFAPTSVVIASGAPLVRSPRASAAPVAVERLWSGDRAVPSGRPSASRAPRRGGGGFQRNHIGLSGGCRRIA